MQEDYASTPFEALEGSPIEAGANWLMQLATGSLATALCVLAIAVVGLLMLGGRLPVRDGLRVVLGCFVLLGAPLIAEGFVATGRGLDASAPAANPQRELTDLRKNLPPSAFDPYAGASLRQD